jgi:hypothetical protein
MRYQRSKRPIGGRAQLPESNCTVPLIQRHVLFGGLDRKARMQSRPRPDDELAAEFSFGYRGRRLVIVDLALGDVLVDRLLDVSDRLLHRGRPP